MLIDSHHHLWAYDSEEYGWINDQMSVLRQDFLAPQLREIAAESGVDGFVSVQARQSMQETKALLQIAHDEPLIRGVVGWIGLADSDVEAQLESVSGREKLVGMRHVVQDEPNDRFLDGEAFNRGVAMLAQHNLVYDILIFAKQLPAAIDFADRHESLPMVVDHMAKPTIQGGIMDAGWEAGFRELARRPHLTCKFSGVATEVRDAEWNIDTVRPYWDVALEAFGPKRLMFGSDWPVCLLRTGHKQWLDTVRDLASELSADEQADFFAGNAIKAYGLHA
ncbi:amidohydrolase family protein [Rhodopirellula sp. JC740]|uniref:Amidohydrolase family protein n=1 Tax=Rhodopirellula halodulae TaxID=2894198 RepID=A0ABS8NGU8_9BACT|nr:amidohydrolase family protein [Rhodopirellula sp. JC740]MCC9641711.1 amidohydrolase family protein [Rhodopirellula sp. JC740]